MMKQLRDRMRVMTPAEFRSLESKADKIKVDLLALFHEHVATAMSTMRRLLAAPRYADAEWRNELHVEAHNLKGLGGSFDYDLVTIVSGSLCRIARNEGLAQDAPQQRLLAAHVAALDVIIARKLTGEGGRHGRDLLTTLGIQRA